MNEPGLAEADGERSHALFRREQGLEDLDCHRDGRRHEGRAQAGRSSRGGSGRSGVE